jgi:hypothetical protein
MESGKFGIAMLASFASMIMYFILRGMFATNTQFTDFMMLLYGILAAFGSFITLVFAIIELNDHHSRGVSVVFLIGAVIMGACSYFFFQQIGTDGHLVIRSLGYIGGLI